MSPLYALDSLVTIVRLRAGMRVWAKAPDADPTGYYKLHIGSLQKIIYL